MPETYTIYKHIRLDWHVWCTLVALGCQIVSRCAAIWRVILQEAVFETYGVFRGKV